MSDGLRVWDLSAGQSHTLLLADGDCVQPVLLYCGQQKEPVQTERLNQSESSSKRSPNRVERYTVMPTLLPFCIEVCRSKAQLNTDSKENDGWSIFSAKARTYL